MSLSLSVAGETAQPARVVSDPVDLGAVASGIRRRLFGIVLTVGAALLLATALITVLPRAYQAQTKILVRVGREQIGPLEQSGTRFGNFIMNQRVETTNDELEMLRRPQLMDEAFPQLAALLAAHEAARPAHVGAMQVAKTLLFQRIEAAWTPLRSWFEEYGVLTHASAAERLRRRFIAALDVAGVRETNILVVGFTWDDPVFAAEALNIYTETYRREHVRLENNVKGMAELYAAQATRTEAGLTAATRELDDYLLQQGASDPAAERQVIIARLQSLEKEANDAATTEQQIKQQLDTYRTRFSQTRDWPETSALGQSAIGGLADIDAKHIDLLVARDRLLTQFRPESRQVQDIEGQLASLRQTKFDALRHALETRQTAEHQQLTLAQEAITQARARLDVLTRIQHRVGELQQHSDQLVEQLKSYRGQAEYLTLQEALNREGLSSVTVLGAAVPPTQPSAPRKGVILALSFAFATLLALGYAAIAELRDGRLRDARQVRAVMGLPVLAVVWRA